MVSVAVNDFQNERGSAPKPPTGGNNEGNDGCFVDTEENDQMPSASAPSAPPLAAESKPDTEWAFKVAIEKKCNGLGVDLSPHDGRTLLVGKLRQGAFHDWNISRPAGAADIVRPGDRIVAVNGVTADSEDILSKMRKDTFLSFTIRRLLDFNVRVPRSSGEHLGLWAVDTGATLRVTRVERGPAENANRSFGAELIVAGDEIYSCNGVSTSGSEIQRVLQNGGDVELKVRRSKMVSAEALDRQSEVKV